MIHPKQIIGYEEQINRIKNSVNILEEKIDEPIPTSRIVTDVSKNNNEKYTLENLLDDVISGDTDIKREQVPIPEITNTAIVFDGTKQGPTISEFNEEIVGINGDYEAINAGTYSFTIFLKNKANYIWEDETVSIKKCTWTIARKPTAIPELANIDKTYTGREQAPDILYYDREAVVLGGDVTSDFAGPKTITFSLASTNYIWEDETSGQKSANWSISKATINVPSIEEQNIIYNRKEQSPSLDYDSNHVTATGDLSATDAGTYTIIFSINDKNNYIWSDETSVDKTRTWSISSKKVSIPTLADLNKTYTGESLSPIISAFDENEIVQTGDSSATDIGEYTINWELTNENNYIWEDNTVGIKSKTWKIEKMLVSIPSIVDEVKTYNGIEQSPTLTYNPDYVSVSGDTTGTNAGTYTIYFDLTNENTKWNNDTIGQRSLIWKINPKKITIPSLSNVTKTYTGSSQGPTVTNYDVAAMTQTGTASAINAGTYTVSWALKDINNTCWNDNTVTQKSDSWTINKTTGTMSLSVSSVSLDIENDTKTVTVTRQGDGQILASSSSTSIATVSVSDNIVTIKGIATGSATITISVAAGTNYEAMTSKTVAVACQMVPTFAQETWDNISAYAQNGTADLHYDIGDRKTITLNGKLGTIIEIKNEQYDVYILDINKKINGKADNNIILGGFIKSSNPDKYKYVVLADYVGRNFNSSTKMMQQRSNLNGNKYFNMNHSYQQYEGMSNTSKWDPGEYGTNWGGWKGCDLRYDILGGTSKPPSMYGPSNLKTISNVGYDATQATITSPVADTLMAALPEDFRSKLKLWTRYGNVKCSDYRASAIGTYTDAITIPLLSDIATLDQIKTNATYQSNGSNEAASTYNGELKCFKLNEYEFNYNEPLKFFANGNPVCRYTNGSDGQNYDQKIYYWLATTYCNEYMKTNNLDPTKYNLHTSNGNDRFFTLSSSDYYSGNLARNLSISSSLAFIAHGIFPMFKI